MIGQLFVLEPSCGAWYIEGVNLKPGKPFQMTVKLMNNKTISGFVDGGTCHPAAKTSAVATKTVNPAPEVPKTAEKPAAKPDDKKGK